MVVLDDRDKKDKMDKKKCRQCQSELPIGRRSFCSDYCKLLEANKKANERWANKECRPDSKKLQNHRFLFNLTFYSID